MSKQLTVDELKARIDAGQLESGELLLLDVREVSEFATGHVPGAVNMPMALVPLRVSEINKKSLIAVICESGGRSSQTAQWLANYGFNAASIMGGTGYWRSKKYAIAH